MQNVAPSIAEEHPPDHPRSAAVSARAPARISAALPSSDTALRSEVLWSTLLHVPAILLLVGGAAYGLSGDLSGAVVRQAWPVMGLLAMAYVAAVVLHAKLDQFPFTHPFETALLSVSATLVPTGGFVTGMLGAPLDTLGLVAAGGSVGWYLLTQLVRTSRDSHLPVLPGGAANRFFAPSGIPMADEVGKPRPEMPRLAGANGSRPEAQASPVNGQNGRVHRSAEWRPVDHARRIHQFLASRPPPNSVSETNIEVRTDRPYQYAKRAMDVLLVVLSLPVTVPLIAITALAVRIGSRGPVLFWQERVGRGGETFHMVKFRSMHVGHKGEGRAVFTDEDDDRVTPVGRFIRASRLDELPQIWNVLRGEMSLIGPRPEQVGLADDLGDALRLYDARHLVQPGITGWAQVLQGYAADVDETRRKLEYDLYYIKHQSILLDLLIVYLTVKTLLTGFGAR